MALAERRRAPKLREAARHEGALRGKARLEGSVEDNAGVTWGLFEEGGTALLPHLQEDQEGLDALQLQLHSERTEGYL